MSSVMMNLLSTSLFGDSKATRHLKELVIKAETCRSEIDDLGEIQQELLDERSKNAQLEVLIRSVVDASPDMLWAKDLGPFSDGFGARFIFTNKALRDKILISPTLTDSLNHDAQFFAIRQQKLDNTYTFGQNCENTDVETLKQNQNKKEAQAITCNFLESGVVNGQMIRLTVSKRPMYDPATGACIGIVGSGRDVTQDYNRLHGIQDIWDGKKEDCPTNGENCQEAAACLDAFIRTYSHDSTGE